MKILFTMVLTTLALFSYSQGCTISTSNLTQLTDDDGSGNCTYSIDILFTEGSGPDNGTLTFSSGSVTILAGAGPHTCACSGNTYTVTFEAICGSTASFNTFHNNSGNGNDCSITTIGISLPVEWLSFELKKEQEEIVGIYWSTAIEINNDHFEVEYSKDGKEFNYLATVQGSGTTYKQTDYSYSHTQNLSGIVYYRIKQIDYDGNFSYSEVREINLKKELMYSLSPNPVQETLYIKGNIDQIKVSIIDVRGNIVITSTQSQIDTKDLKSGIYTIQIEAGNTSQSQQFIKVD